MKWAYFSNVRFIISKLQYNFSYELSKGEKKYDYFNICRENI